MRCAPIAPVLTRAILRSGRKILRVSREARRTRRLAAAATKIQALARGVAGRKRVKVLRAEWRDKRSIAAGAALVRVSRGMLGRRRVVRLLRLRARKAMLELGDGNVGRVRARVHGLGQECCDGNARLCIGCGAAGA